MFQYEAKIIRIVDGDTLWMDIDLGFCIHHQIDVRLARIDTPETVYFKLGGIEDKAKNYVMNCVPPGATCIVDISKPDKYGRFLADVRFLPGEIDRAKILAGGRCLNDELVRGGFAKPYAGGKK